MPELSSFTRTIPSYKGKAFVDEVLLRRDHYIPLAYRPTKAVSGDFIYLIFRGSIVGRARISRIDAMGSGARRKAESYPRWAKWIVRYGGKWQTPPRDIRVQGHQSVRYLETHSLEHLDDEIW